MSENIATNSEHVSMTERALDEFETFMKQDENQGKAIRLVVAGNGCSGPMIGLAIDDPSEEESIFSDRGVTLIAEAPLLEHLSSRGGVTIEYVDDPTYGSGFRLQMNVPETSCGSCGGGCG